MDETAGSLISPIGRPAVWRSLEGRCGVTASLPAASCLAGGASVAIAAELIYFGG
jgi:hypothetical protein